MHGSLHMEHDFKGEYIQKHLGSSLTHKNKGGGGPLKPPVFPIYKPLAKYSLA